MADALDELADLIAGKALQRLRSEQQAATSTSGAPTDHDPKTCSSEGCEPCESRESCGTRNLAQGGAARIAPIAIRTSKDIAPLIDHTLLKADATREEVIKLCDEAVKWGFATVCVNSSNVGLAARILAGSPVKAIAVVGFPLGAGTTSAKVFETREAVRCGAKEIDMVINIGALKSKDYVLVQDDIRAIVEAAKPSPVKVILETGALTRDEKVIACALAKAAGAAFVKTSTGFGPGGATAEDIALMRSIVGDTIGVKASGGVRTTEDAQKMIAAGANRIGASASIAIVTGTKPSTSKY